MMAPMAHESKDPQDPPEQAGGPPARPPVRPDLAQAGAAHPGEARTGSARSEPALPDRSADEADIGWGDRPETGPDDQLLADRPPHWDQP
jgi:hypothetical protein